jgi:hypothetical protein
MVSALRTMGPYVALELIVPGGTLLSLLLWYTRNRLELIVPGGTLLSLLLWYTRNRRAARALAAARS